MSLPVSKILKASKSIMAIADLNHNSPSQVASQNVNVVINNPSDIKTKPDNKVCYPDNKNNETQETFQEAFQEASIKQPSVENPYNDLPRERDIDSAMEKTSAITDSIEDKNNAIKALSLIIEILQNNPLIINKFVVAEREVLEELIRLLVNADEVDIECGDIECSCTKPTYLVVKRIFIEKDSLVYTIDQCPVILKLFDYYKISILFVALP